MIILPMAKLPNARDGSNAPPYLPFSRFLESLDSIATCLPREINRATLNCESPYIGTLLANTYVFLGLADEAGAPTPVLHRLANEHGTRAEILRDVLRGAYGEAIDNLHEEQAAEAIEALLAKYRLSGNTHRKAVSFLLQACRYAGIAGSVASRGSRISHAKTASTFLPRSNEATAVTVPLRSGGEISLIGRFNPFTISPNDRNFVFKLVDQLNAYRSGDERAREPESDMEDEAPF
jgi:hypothetical protein